MKKIVSLFQRNYEGDRLVRDEIVPGAEWVANGEGTAYRKFDGTACMVRDGKLYKRYDAKHGKTPPESFEQCQEPDPVTGHWPGWIPVGDEPESRWHREAFNNTTSGGVIPIADGTYEAVGPHFQGNPEGVLSDRLWPHVAQPLVDAPRTFEDLKKYLASITWEGIVWHHPDGRMVKIKRRDFFVLGNDRSVKVKQRVELLPVKPPMPQVTA